MQFSVLTDGWIPVLTADGTPVELGLRPMVERAHELRGFAADSPLDEFAILRMSLAYLHRALRGPTDVPAWTALWDEGRFPTDRLDEYDAQFAERFELFHPVAPFYQCAQLAGRVRPWSEDLVPGNRPPFLTRAGEAVTTLTRAEAARWVVLMQNFDGAGIKTGDPNDPETKGGRGYGSPRGWADRLANTALRGDSLFRTLMLNLASYAWSEADQPAWERPPQTPGRSGRLPDGRCDVYTWQPDRLLLGADQGRLVGSVVSPGDHADVTNAMALEPLTSWRFNKAASDRTGRNVYSPATFNAPDQLWRGLGQLLSTKARGSASAEQSPGPGVVEWLARCASQTRLEPHVEVRRLIIERDSNNTIIESVKSDHLDLPTRLASDSQLAGHVAEEIDLLGDVTRSVGRLAYALSIAAAGATKESKREKAQASAAESSCFAVLDPVVRAWLAGLDVTGDVNSQVAELREQCRRLMLHEADRLLAQVPPSAWRGREGASSPVHAHVACRRSINKTLGKEFG